MFSANELKDSGNQLAGKGQYREALEKYIAATNADGTLVAAWLNQGIMRKKLGEYSEAIDAFKRALSIKPNYEKASINLADCYLHFGEYKKSWGIFTDLSPTSEPKNVECALGEFRCKQHISATVAFCCVDLKLDLKGNVKILEFGPGLQSAFSGLRVLGFDIINLLLTASGELSLPPLEILSIPGVPIPPREAEARMKPYLSTSRTFNFDLTALKNFKAVVGGIALRPLQENILPMDSCVLDYIFENKELTHRAFVDTEQREMRPKTLIFQRNYSPSMAKEILDQLPSAPYFVLKMPDLEGGKGVIVVARNELEKTLRNLLEKQNMMFLDWISSESPIFMVEEYIVSKPIKNAGKTYDPTMRVALLFVRDGNSTYCKPFACYWKLPPKPVNDASSSLREKTVSSYSDTRHDSLQVDAEDQKCVYDALERNLHLVINKMMTFDVFSHIEAEKNRFSKKHNTDSWLRFATKLTSRGNYTLSEYAFRNAKDIVPQNHLYRYYHEKGIHCHLKGDYDEAINNYNESIRLAGNYESIFYRRGVTYYSLQKWTEARQDFQQALRYNPNDSWVRSFCEMMDFSLSPPQVNYRR